MAQERPEQVAQPSRRANIQLRFTQFGVPPVEDALIIGKAAPIGSHAIAKAFEEMSPHTFRLIEVDHPVVEAVLVRVSNLRKLPENVLIPMLLRHAEAIMDETETLHLSALISVTANEEIEL